MEKLLKEKSYKVTPARVAILEVFSGSKAPLDAETVWGRLKKSKKGKKINGVTVYRTLTSFEETGILKRVDLRKDSAYFELNSKHHHHLICINCEKIEDFENKKLEKVLAEIKSSRFKNIKEHALELFGVCKACA